MHRNRAILLLAAGLLSTGGCATVKSHWPFGKTKVAAPELVQELHVQAADAASAVLQYWERNTLVVDLTNVAGSGQLQLIRDPARTWPVRVAFRMAPGRFEALEVQGAQRVVVPVAAGNGAVTSVLPAGAYETATTSLSLRWGARADF
jgi:hypothetical protein